MTDKIIWENIKEGAMLKGMDLSGASLYNRNLSNANLSQANLSKTNLRKANLSNANLSQARLDGADLREANLTGADLSKACLYRANLSGANLNGACLFNALLSNANLRGASLLGVDLAYAHLRYTDLTDAVQSDFIMPEPISSDDAIQKPAIEWIDIPAGTFIMGSPEGESEDSWSETQHQVTLSAFKMSKFAITFDQYDLYCEITGKEKPRDEGWGRGTRPVIRISWNDAYVFARWMGCRLPTEAEWEYACRAGTTTAFYTGSKLNVSQANYGNNEFNIENIQKDKEKTMPVGSFPPNAWGLYDMHGNVWEWCNDWFGDFTTEAQTNPQGSTMGPYHVCRGGCWYVHEQGCRSAFRIYFIANDRNCGIRLVK
jgi:formylglycine-generating enzyme required for sulfatase activity